MLTAEDFVLFKRLSTRERDLLDAASVSRSLGDDLERDLIEVEVGTLIQVLPDHDLEMRWRHVRDEAEHA